MLETHPEIHDSLGFGVEYDERPFAIRDDVGISLKGYPHIEGRLPNRVTLRTDAKGAVAAWLVCALAIGENATIGANRIKLAIVLRGKNPDIFDGIV